MTGSSRSLSDPAVHPLPLSGPCRAQVQTHRLAFLIPPSTLSVGVSRPYPNSDQSRSPWGQPPRSPSPASGPGALGLLGRGQAVQTCPELLVTSYLLLWGRECCRAGQREVTPPMFGCVWVCPRGGGTGLWPWGSSRNPARLPPGLHLPPSLGEPSLSPEGPGQGKVVARNLLESALPLQLSVPRAPSFTALELLRQELGLTHRSTLHGSWHRQGAPQIFVEPPCDCPHLSLPWPLPALCCAHTHTHTPSHTHWQALTPTPTHPHIHHTSATTHPSTHPLNLTRQPPAPAPAAGHTPQAHPPSRAY